MKRQASDEQHREVVLGDAEPGAQSAPGCGTGTRTGVVFSGRVEIAIDTERNHRQAHRAAEVTAAPAFEIVGVLLEHALDSRLHCC